MGKPCGESLLELVEGLGQQLREAKRMKRRVNLGILALFFLGKGKSLAHRWMTEAGE